MERQLSFDFAECGTDENDVSHVVPKKTVTAEEIVGCYGTRRIVGHRDQCARRNECPWGEACASRSGEEAEDLHENIETITVGQMLFDPEEMLHEVGSSVCQSPEDLMEAEENFHDPVMALIPERFRNRIPQKLWRDAGMCVRCAVEEMATMYLSKRNVFDALVRKIYSGMSQSDISRLRGVSRQHINQSLMRELGISQKKTDEKRKFVAENERLKSRISAFESMTKSEADVYRLRFSKGMSATEISRETGLSLRQVYRIVKKLSNDVGN